MNKFTPLLIFTLCYNCTESEPDSSLLYIDFRQEMRDLVQEISTYAKGIRLDFIIIPQNGPELLTDDGEPTGTLDQTYLIAIDGIGREDLFYGYEDDNLPTPQAETDYLLAFMNLAKNNGIEVLVTDYCSTPSYVDDSYAQNASRGFISLAADHRSLDNIPVYPIAPYGENDLDITSLPQARNFLYLINPGNFSDKYEFLNTLSGTNYDIVLIDLFFDDDTLTADDITSLKTKANGGSRQVIAYMSIGEAEDYRYYWQSDWNTNPPSWLEEENPNWPGNYKVRYWDPEWKTIIFGNSDAFLDKIINAAFDGVYLDIIDAFEYFEER